MDLLEYLGGGVLAEGNGGGWYTARQLCRSLRLTNTAVMNRLHRLHDAGKIEVGRTQHVDIAGRVTTVPAYRFVVELDQKED